MLAAISTFAQSYSYYTYNTPTSSSSHISVALVMAYVIILVVVLAITAAAMWRIFTKAGQPGWAAIVPIYNWFVLLKIVGRPWWWFLLLFVGVVPFVGWIVSVVISIIVMNDLAKSFGKGTGMTVLLVLLPVVGLPMLGFGSAKYQGPAALQHAGKSGGTPNQAA